MTKQLFVYIIGVSLLMVNCTQKETECEICGEFNLVNFSKNELNHQESEEVSIRRNLYLDGFSGSDYYTIWSWDENQPEASWTENMQKDIRVTENKFILNEDGTWNWLIGTEEYFKSPPFYGVNDFSISKNYWETGTWNYANSDNEYIQLTRAETRIENRVFVSDKTNWEATVAHYPFSKYTRYDKNDEGRCFEVVKDVDSGNLILSSTADENIYSNGIHSAAYSLTEGNVYMALSQKEKSENLAYRVE